MYPQLLVRKPAVVRHRRPPVCEVWEDPQQEWSCKDGAAQAWGNLDGGKDFPSLPSSGAHLVEVSQEKQTLCLCWVWSKGAVSLNLEPERLGDKNKNDA